LITPVRGVLVALAALAACTGASGDTAQAEWMAWRAHRLERLTAPDGWLTLVGLFWLDGARARLGAGPDCEFRLADSRAPRVIGTFVRAGDAVTFEPARGVDARRADGDDFSAPLRPDSDGAPSIVTAATIAFYLVERGGRLGVRVKDSRAPTREHFAGLDYFPFDPSWRVQARFHPVSGATLAVPTVLGTIAREPSPGYVEFERDGHTVRLHALDGGNGELFLVFGDASNGRETYGGGRFLAADAPHGGMVELDFNRAYNPPCAFTEFATCPLPPAGNRTPVAVRAGERRYGSH